MQNSRKCIEFLVFQNKIYKIYIHSDFYVVLNIAFLKKTKGHMENSVNFGQFRKKKLIIQYNHISGTPHFKDKIC